MDNSIDKHLIRSKCIQEEKIDLIGIAESHLKGNSEISVDGFKWYGHNRTVLHKRAVNGSGGVGFLVNRDLLASYNLEIIDKSVEGIMWITVDEKS